LVGDLDHLSAMRLEVGNAFARKPARIQALPGFAIEGVAWIAVSARGCVAADSDEVRSGGCERLHVVDGLAHARSVSDREGRVGDKHQVSPCECWVAGNDKGQTRTN